jgi:hypothetical protein
MHPWGAYHHYHRRGGSRFIWFTLGFGAAAWYYHVKEETNKQGGWGCTWKHRRELEALRQAGAGMDPPMMIPAPQQPLLSSPSSPPVQEWGWHGQSRWGSTPAPAAQIQMEEARKAAEVAQIQAREIMRAEAAMSSTPEAPSPTDWEAVKRERWAEHRAKVAAMTAEVEEWAGEKQQLRALGKQAEEKVCRRP